MNNNSMLKLGQTLQQKLESDKQQLTELENQSQQRIKNAQQQLENSLNELSASVQRTTSNATQQVNKNLQSILDNMQNLQQQWAQKQQSEILELFQQQRTEIQQQLQKDSARMIWTTRTPYLVLFIALLVLIAATWIATPAGLWRETTEVKTSTTGNRWVILTSSDWTMCNMGNHKAPCKQIK